MIRSRIATLFVFAVVVLSGCSSADDPATSTTEPLPAPDFATGVDWLNVASAPSIARLEGKVTVVYFWTTSCLSCRDVIDDVERLENEFPESVVPIGIHTGRFDAESDAFVIEQFLTRRGLDHAIANDEDYRIWQEWEITNWPTTLVIDQTGMVTAKHSGDDAYEALEPVVESLVDDPSAPTNPENVVFTNQPEPPPPTVLSFPEAVLADPAGGRLFIADTNHHRIVVADLDTNDVLEVIGNGDEGFADGDADQASFSEPRGMALSDDGSTLYVADSGNHLIREVNLTSRRVATVAGTGERGRPQEGEPLDSPLNYPWDLEVIDQDLYVSVAGANQIWLVDLAEAELKEAAGTGQAGVTDGPANNVRLAQPSGLAPFPDDGLVIADAGSSSLRLLGESEVSALIGPVTDLFDFGEADGPAATARFQ
ncbi:MAG: redoxin domain-containing protein, partial [Acidimicrobiia bacterium]|nr:redoxin domain-containing protein [Acidimicrobiia bacterium]